MTYRRHYDTDIHTYLLSLTYILTYIQTDKDKVIHRGALLLKTKFLIVFTGYLLTIILLKCLYII